jgi:uncharacterized protein DUF1524
MIRWSALVAVALLAAACTAGAVTTTDRNTASRTTTDRTATGRTPTVATSPGTAPSSAEPTATLLAELLTKGRAPKTGYDRAAFGPAWSDDNDDQYGHNGCDTRNDILRRDLHDISLDPDTHGCVVLTGTLDDPYTGKTIVFTRGVGTSDAVQIDHVVALSDAWQKGAQQWSAQHRQDFANDPLELLAVDGPANEAKGDGDAATWLPPNKAYRCVYVTRQVEVKAKYALWVTSAERAAMARVLAACPPG